MQLSSLMRHIKGDKDVPWTAIDKDDFLDSKSKKEVKLWITARTKLASENKRASITRRGKSSLA